MHLGAVCTKRAMTDRRPTGAARVAFRVRSQPGSFGLESHQTRAGVTNKRVVGAD